jgi:hypothetical protein
VAGGHFEGIRGNSQHCHSVAILVQLLGIGLVVIEILLLVFRIGVRLRGASLVAPMVDPLDALGQRPSSRCLAGSVVAEILPDVFRGTEALCVDLGLQVKREKQDQNGASESDPRCRRTSSQEGLVDSSGHSVFT